MSSDLKIVVLEGEDGVNILKKKTAVMPVVEVRDKNNNPVGGAAVTFASPNSGPSVTFANGSRSMTAMTDSAGRASVTSMKPTETGSFKIDVTASKQDHGTAHALISQANFLTLAAANAARSSSGAAGGGAGATAAATTAVEHSHRGVVIGGVLVAAGIGVVTGVLSTSEHNNNDTCLSGCK